MKEFEVYFESGFVNICAERYEVVGRITKFYKYGVLAAYLENVKEIIDVTNILMKNP